MTNHYLDIRDEGSFEVSAPSMFYPALCGLAVIVLSLIYHAGTNTPDEKKDSNEKRRVTMVDVFVFCTLAGLLSLSIASFCSAISWQVTYYEESASLQNASIVVKSLEAYQAFAMQRRENILKDLKENKTIDDDPMYKAELEAELRVENKNLKYNEEQLKQARAKKANLDLFIASNKDRFVVKEFKKLRRANEEMAIVVAELTASLQGLKEEMINLKNTKNDSKKSELTKVNK